MSTFFCHQNIVLAYLPCVLSSGANTIVTQFGPHLLLLIDIRDGISIYRMIIIINECQAVLKVSIGIGSIKKIFKNKTLSRSKV